ncbi:MAG: TetR/AcrR family transcriptional regulator [Actinomycetota bacterium]|nr:TetR/AcrR family transcriptional regulator [Actinomycetota bacterium]MDQ3643587.1 TetR/AcrR family transcriptional regulator [Actinomycetota bacterium]
MPRLWADTIDTHRRQVNDAILDATAALIAEQGPLSVAMSAIAERAGIGRATLYKYFPDVESIVIAWHTRDFAEHLHRLKGLSETDDVTLEDLAEFVRAQRRHHPHRKGSDIAGALVQSLADADGVIEDRIEPEIIALLTGLLTRLARRKEVRGDHDPAVLARWLLHAVHAPGDLDHEAVSQLVVDSLAPQPARRRRSRGRI